MTKNASQAICSCEIFSKKVGESSISENNLRKKGGWTMRGWKVFPGNEKRVH